ncbi:hypothetical protein [Curtobacterium sp. MCPF17_052]|uniref:hypothetical protein n=1 Tax=Curtobacterium sp. MCPF17_052 TaxID=2175655 RepID=UPI0024DF86FC|nr:hypothetical protein [Curtobacterium sp. MCPF17_052]WIB12272.1 hypothetical protein DEJ36_16385 [Curtobacterium sp. MCPF17_052]
MLSDRRGDGMGLLRRCRVEVLLDVDRRGTCGLVMDEGGGSGGGYRVYGCSQQERERGEGRQDERERDEEPPPRE